MSFKVRRLGDASKNILRCIIKHCLFLFLVSCSSENHENLSPHVRCIYTVNAKTTKELKKERNLLSAGFGGEMMKIIRMTYLAFDYRGETTLSEKREMIVYAVQTYLTNINSYEEIKPHLANNPFLPENIHIDIVFRGSDGSEPSDDVISFVVARGGKVYYYSYKDRGYQTLELEETFEEAKKKLIEDQTKPKIVKVNPLRNFLECLLLG